MKNDKRKPDMRFYRRSKSRKGEGEMLLEAVQASLLRLYQICPSTADDMIAIIEAQAQIEKRLGPMVKHWGTKEKADP